MPITITADDAAHLRAQVADLFPALAATVPVAQAPSASAKEAIEDREVLEAELRHAVSECETATTNLAKLEAAYSAQADLLREAQAVRGGEASQEPAALEAIAKVCDILGSPRDIAALPALVAEVKQARDQARDALKEAQEALEGMQLEVKRLRDLGVGTPAEGEKKATRKKAPPKTEEPAGDAKADAAAVYAERGYDAAGTPVSFPASFTSLPELPWDVEDGTGVIIAIENGESPTGWLTPGGVVERRFEKTDRYQVKLVGGSFHTVHRAAMRGVPEAVRTDNPALEVPLERAPVTPLHAPAPAPVNDAVVDRLVTDDERKELKALQEKLKLTPGQVVGLIQKHFAPKTSSAELTVTDLGQLREHMDREASIPF